MTKIKFYIYAYIPGKILNYLTFYYGRLGVKKFRNTKLNNSNNYIDIYLSKRVYAELGKDDK